MSRGSSAKENTTLPIKRAGKSSTKASVPKKGPRE